MACNSLEDHGIKYGKVFFTHCSSGNGLCLATYNRWSACWAAYRWLLQSYFKISTIGGALFNTIPLRWSRVQQLVLDSVWHLLRVHFTLLIHTMYYTTLNILLYMLYLLKGLICLSWLSLRHVNCNSFSCYVSIGTLLVKHFVPVLRKVLSEESSLSSLQNFSTRELPQPLTGSLCS